MARLVRTWSGAVTVEHHLFIVTGFHSMSEPSPLTGDLIAAPYIPSIGPDNDSEDIDRLYIESASTSHDAEVEVQLWDGQLDPNTDTWDAATELQADCPEGHIKVGELTGSPEDFEVALPTGGYTIRVYSRGREEVQKAVAAWEDALVETDEDLDHPSRVERYVIQLGPVDSRDIAV